MVWKALTALQAEDISLNTTTALWRPQGVTEIIGPNADSLWITDLRSCAGCKFFLVHLEREKMGGKEIRILIATLLPTYTYPIYSKGKETVGHLMGEQCSLLALQSLFFSVVFYEGPVSCLTSNLARPLTSFLKPIKSAESILLFKMLFQVKTITENHNW